MDNHSGTSAAAPLAAGMIALLLSVRPELTWRDVQHVLVRAGEPVDTASGRWITNAAGHAFSIRYGFGRLTAAGVLAAADAYTPLAADIASAFTAHTSGTLAVGTTIAARQKTVATYTAPASGTGHYVPHTLEHVTVTVHVTHTERANLTVSLTSPSGTAVVLAPARSGDRSREGYPGTTFTSRATWGEDPAGAWTLTIDSVSDVDGVLTSWELAFMGQGAADDASSETISTSAIAGAVAGGAAVLGFIGLFAYGARRRTARRAGLESPSLTLAESDPESANDDTFEAAFGARSAGSGGDGAPGGNDRRVRGGWWVWRPRTRSADGYSYDANDEEGVPLQQVTLDPPASPLRGRRTADDDDGAGSLNGSDMDGVPHPVALRDDLDDLDDQDAL